MIPVRLSVPTFWPDDLETHEGCFERLDDHLDAAAIQARREEIDRIAEPLVGIVMEEQALAGGSFWLGLLALAAGVVTICVLGVLAYVLIH